MSINKMPFGKVGVITDEVGQDFLEAVKFIDQIGIRYIEIHSLWGKTVESLSQSEVKKVIKIVKNHNLEVSNLAPTIFFLSSVSSDEKIPEPPNSNFLAIRGTIEDHLSSLKKCAEIGRKLGTNKIRLFGFRKQGQLSDEKRDRIVRAMTKAKKIAESYDLILLLENCPYTYLNPATATQKMLRKMDCPNIELLWDPGNSFKSNINPYPDEYSKIKKDIGHIHLKNRIKNERDQTYEYRSLKEGKIDYFPLLKELAEGRYEGVISLEPELQVEGSSKLGVKKVFNELEEYAKKLATN